MVIRRSSLQSMLCTFNTELANLQEEKLPNAQRMNQFDLEKVKAPPSKVNLGNSNRFLLIGHHCRVVFIPYSGKVISKSRTPESG